MAKLRILSPVDERQFSRSLARAISRRSASAIALGASIGAAGARPKSPDRACTPGPCPGPNGRANYRRSETHSTPNKGLSGQSSVGRVTSEIEADNDAAAMQFADLMCLRQNALVFSIGRHRMHGFAARFPIGKACRGQKLPRI